MTVHYTDDAVTLHHGDCLDILRELPDCSVDSVVTDPPYGLEFMGRHWDDHVDGPTFGRWCTLWAAECLRVLKPGGHLLAFGGTRTWHRLACAVEDAGFEIRDSIAWLHAQGFPKSLNLPGGLGTALKPAFEPIVVGRKPLTGTVAANVLAHGTGALNIDGCRVKGETVRTTRNTALGVMNDDGWVPTPAAFESHPAGRWPANVALDHDQAAELDRQSGVSRDGTVVSERRFAGWEKSGDLKPSGQTYGGEGGASRFFPTFRYEAKAPTVERPRDGEISHPTVKPLDLMRWLVRLVTPPGGTVLEPFAGSGTTAEACVIEGMRCIAIEREADYLPLIVARLTKPIQVDLFGGIA